MTAGAPRATIELLGHCDNACVFCAQAGLSPRDLTGDALGEALTAALRVSDELTLVGGEPTLRDDLPAVVTAARTAGFRRVGLQTHARRLEDRAYVRTLASAGLTDVHGSLHGPMPVHDYHTGISGSFGATAAGLAAASAAGLTVVVTTVLTRSNYRVLATVPGMLAARGVSAWQVAVPHAAGRARTDFDRVVPRLAMALPFALHALQAARAARLVAWISGAPLCLLGPYAGHVLPAPSRAYGAPCTDCAVRLACPGLDPVYLARFAGDELSSRATTVGPAYVGDRAASLARMFVGPGALAPTAPGVTSHGTPGVSGDAEPSGGSSRGRVVLPVVTGG